VHTMPHLERESGAVGVMHTMPHLGREDEGAHNAASREGESGDASDAASREGG
jgi:hypothetical protein